MDIEQIRDYCLAKPEVTESFPFGPGALVFKVQDKMFLLISLEDVPLRMNVKCMPEKAILLRERYEYVLPGYHMNKKHWNTVILEPALHADRVKEWIDDSYRLVYKGKRK
jgi:predicted DNA-binding protein (MmcQ/YjbR family)